MSPNPVQAALDDGVKPVLLEAAAHELGHAITWRAHGFRVSHMAVSPGWFGGVASAYCRLDATPRLDERNAQGYLVGLLGGLAGHTRFLRRHLGTGPGGARGPASGDLSEFRRLARYWPGRYSDTSAATSRATALLAGYGDTRLDRLTARLASTGRLSGGAL